MATSPQSTPPVGRQDDTLRSRLPYPLYAKTAAGEVCILPEASTAIVDGVAKVGEVSRAAWDIAKGMPQIAKLLDSGDIMPFKCAA